MIRLPNGIEEGSEKPTAKGESARLVSQRLRIGAQGAIIGLLSTFALLQFRMDAGRAELLLAISLIAGAAVALSRARWLLWWGAGLATGWIALIAFTPVAHWLVSDITPIDQRGPADAVIVLGCGVMKDGTPGSSAEDRLLQAASIVREGDVRCVVLCGLLWNPVIRRQLHGSAADIPLAWSGPVYNTHDEALATARLARKRGWKRVIVVTQAWHMRRAAAVFRATGLEVLESSAAETRYDLADPEQLADRFQLVRDWLHEAIGLRVYRMRGWIL
jgi:uncharacterized SAM-binding protein YcdF (DUF218 family)